MTRATSPGTEPLEARLPPTNRITLNLILALILYKVYPNPTSGFLYGVNIRGGGLPADTVYYTALIDVIIFVESVHLYTAPRSLKLSHNGVGTMGWDRLVCQPLN